MQMVFNHRLEYTGEKNHLGYPIGDASFGFDFTVDRTHFEDDERHGLACDFHETLRDIQHVRAILEELKAARIIEPDDIRSESGVNASEPLRLMAIPLQLPKPNP
ncbi:hypothetical protein D3C77_554160 [compost metagenome]